MTIRPLSPPTAANPTAHYWHNQYERMRRERDGEREARRKYEAALTTKDKAMGVLFERLNAAGVDCSDLIP
jgi:hypothetical protein